MAVRTISLSVTPEANLSRYLQEIRRFPMLTLEEEMNFAKRWQKKSDHEAAHRMVNSHNK